VPPLVVSYTSHPGGAERILADHATAIGHDVIAACPEGWLAERLRDQGVRVFPLPDRPLDLRANPAAALARLGEHGREILRLAMALRPHTLVAWGMRSALGCAAVHGRLPRRRPRFVFQHNDLLPGPVIGRAVRLAAERADLVIALSEAIARDLDPSGALEVEVVRPGVDLERFSPPADPPATPGALFLGAITPWKRPDLAIEAATRAGVPLTLAGAPLDDEGAELESRLRAEQRPGVTFAGRLADPREALRNASVLLHTADREPYGMALVEALACGVPLVAPAGGGPCEIGDDSCARFYRGGSAEAAAAALEAALERRSELAPAARRRAELLFDVNASRRRYAQLAGTETRPPRGRGIALVTVLHDSKPDVEALMASIEKHLPEAHLVAVDSGSTDGGAEAVRSWPGKATVIDMHANKGFGAGTNAGVEAVEEPVTVIVNPDVELVDDSLADLAAAATRHPNRILAPLVLLPDGSRQDSAHPEPAGREEVARTALPKRTRPVRIDPWRADEPKRVGWAVACCLAAGTQTLKQLGPFDPDAFLYAEDLDLGLRAADSGVETWFWPHARVLHKRAHSTAQKYGGEPFELLAQRRRDVIEARRGKTARNRDDLLQAVTFASRIATKRDAVRERSQLKALIRARRGRRAR
jgi:GT2 family glycosyltransferase/glycosyltransferase involved in cell wall biosynthesis